MQYYFVFTVNSLGVRIISVTGTTTTVTFSWIPSLVTKELKYKIRWSTPSNLRRSVDTHGNTSMTLKSLTPGFHYNFSFVTFMSADAFYPFRQTSVVKELTMSKIVFFSFRICKKANINDFIVFLPTIAFYEFCTYRITIVLMIITQAII